MAVASSADRRAGGVLAAATSTATRCRTSRIAELDHTSSAPAPPAGPAAMTVRTDPHRSHPHGKLAASLRAALTDFTLGERLKSRPKSSAPKEPWRSSTGCRAPAEGRTIRADRRGAGSQAGRSAAGDARAHPWRRSSGRHGGSKIRSRSCARSRSDASRADRRGLLASIGSPWGGCARRGLPASEACSRARNTRRRAASGCDPHHRAHARGRRACRPPRGRAVERTRDPPGA